MLMTNDLRLDPATTALPAETFASVLHDRMPGTDAGMTISPIIHPVGGSPDPRSRTFWSATANALYIVRRPGQDLFGPTPDFTEKLSAGNDLVAHGRRGPIGCDGDAFAGLALWEAADRAAQQDRPSAPVAWHAIGRLPGSATAEHWREIVLEVLDREIVAGGMVADWAIHALPGNDGRWVRKPHVHFVSTHRFWKPDRRTGAPNAAWLGTPKRRQRLCDVWNEVSGQGDPAAGFE